MVGWETALPYIKTKINNMACCSEYQTECLRVVTIGYLKSFIGSDIQNSSGNAVYINYSDNTYCPTYGELTGGTFIQNWAQGSTPNGDRDGIVVNSTCAGTGVGYSNNQLVNQRDLSMRYTRFKSFSVSSPGTDVGQCGDYVGLSYTHKYTRYNKSMNNSCAVSTTSSEASDIANGEVTWTPACDWVSVNQSSLVATVSAQPATRTADRRCCTVTGKVTFRTTPHTYNTDICQNALTGDWVFSATSYYDLTVTASTSPVGCCGGEYGLNGTGYYFNRYFWKDSCNREYRESPFDDRYGTESLTGSGGGSCMSCTINGDSSIGSDGGTIQLTANETSAGGTYYTGGTFPAAGCCNDTTNCCTGRSDSASVTLTWHGLSETRPFTQYCPDKDSGCCPEQWVYQSDDCTDSDCGGNGTATYHVYPGKKNEWGVCVADTSQPYRTDTDSIYCGDCPEPPGPGPGPGPGPEPGECTVDAYGVGYSHCEASDDPGTCAVVYCKDGSDISEVTSISSVSSSESWLSGFETTLENKRWVIRAKCSSMPCDGGQRTTTITINTSGGDTFKVDSTQHGCKKACKYCNQCD